MARPAEKARAMMNKWVAMREAGNPSTTRRSKLPERASDCQFVADAERVRGRLIREIAEALDKIQNPGLEDLALRELNDKINQKMREKYHWNKRIFELGGVDYNKVERQRQLEEGVEVTRTGAYRYYGAAKNLPGVQEHLEEQAAKKRRVPRSELYKKLTPDYFGWRDEDDGVLLELEAAATKKQRTEAGEPVTQGETADNYFDLPTEEHIAQAMLDHKKKALLDKYLL